MVLTTVLVPAHGLSLYVTHLQKCKRVTKSSNAIESTVEPSSPLLGTIKSFFPLLSGTPIRGLSSFVAATQSQTQSYRAKVFLRSLTKTKNPATVSQILCRSHPLMKGSGGQISSFFCLGCNPRSMFQLHSVQFRPRDQSQHSSAWPDQISVLYQ